MEDGHGKSLFCWAQAAFWGFRRSQKQLALFHFVEAVRSGSLKRGWLPKKRVRSAPILPVPAALAESDGGALFAGIGFGILVVSAEFGNPISLAREVQTAFLSLRQSA